MEYKCVTACVGFRGRYWNVGDIVDVLDGEERPPEHFKIMGEVTQPSISVNDPMRPVPVSEISTFSEMNEARETLRPKTGMALGLESAKNPIVGRRGRPRKST